MYSCGPTGIARSAGTYTICTYYNHCDLDYAHVDLHDVGNMES